METVEKLIVTEAIVRLNFRFGNYTRNGILSSPLRASVIVLRTTEGDAVRPEQLEAGVQYIKNVADLGQSVESYVRGIITAARAVPAPPEKDFNTKEAAEYLGRSVGYVKDHARELGGIKEGGKWVFPQLALDVVKERV